MKTYWLAGKKGRCASDRMGRVSAVPDELQAVGAAGSIINTRGYSPVTMDDVARKGAASSLSCRNSPIQLALSGLYTVLKFREFIITFPAIRSGKMMNGSFFYPIVTLFILGLVVVVAFSTVGTTFLLRARGL